MVRGPLRPRSLRTSDTTNGCPADRGMAPGKNDHADSALSQPLPSPSPQPIPSKSIPQETAPSGTALHQRDWPAGSLVAIVVMLYVVLATLFALRTPLWQSPDEPAHFNYVKHVATGHGIPVLQPGDWDAAYLEQLKADKFPPELAVDSVRYESHQPPLYYVLAAPVYAASKGLPLGIVVVLVRLVSILFAAAALVVAYHVMATIFPQSRLLQVAVPAFIGLIPQHVHISASINNDALAELVIGLVILACVRFLRESSPVGKVSIRWAVVLGGLTGVALLTKTTVYGAVVVVLAAVILVNRPLTGAVLARRFGDAAPLLGRTARAAGLTLGIALLVGGWWFVRNSLVYGGFDILGLERHNEVVVGQPLARPLLEWLPTFIQVTFQSFWLQFGWMAVPASSAVYAVLAVLTALAIVGAWLFWRRVCQVDDYPAQAAVGLLALTLAIVVVQLVQYNLHFEQPQGRYLYPAIIAIAVFFVGGLAEIALLRPRGLGSSIILAVAAVLLALLVQQNVPRSASPLLFVGLLVPAGLAVLLAVLELVAPGRSDTGPDLGIGMSLFALLGLDVLAIVALLPYLYRA